MDKFILPSDLVVLDIDEDSKVHLIFGDHLLPWVELRLMSIVQQDQLMLRVNEKNVIFDVFAR